MSSGPVAVIDIGSNSIKVLVAAQAEDGSVRSLGMQTLDARISTGLSEAEPRLGEESMERGINAVGELLRFASVHQPERIIVVATSAVREARNGGALRARIQAATGHSVRILSGTEEAMLIGRGLRCDPALRALDDFYVFDLGGGSLECLAFRRHRLHQALSFPLGCVRLTERFAGGGTGLLGKAEENRIATHVRQTFAAGAFRFDLPPAPAVFAGGTMTVARAIVGADAGLPMEETPPMLTVAQLRALLDRLANLPLEERQRVRGLPAARADIFPTALATMLAIADVGRIDAFQHSLYNLRWGLAAEALGVD